MADVPGKDTVVFADGYDLTDNYNAFSVGITRLNGDHTTFGDNSRSRIYTGGIDGTLTLEGFFDAAAGEEDAVFQILVAEANNVMIIPEGNTEGNAGYAASSIASSRTIKGEFEGIVLADIEFPANGGVHRVNLMHALAAETSTGTGTTLDNAASSAGGGVAYLFVTAHGGSFGTFDLDVRHSNDNFVGNDNSLATFTQVTADNAHEQITFTGTVERYLRLSWTLATITSITFACGVHRNEPT